MEHLLPVTGDLLNRVARIDRFLGSWGSGGWFSASRARAIRREARVDSTLAAMRLTGLRCDRDEVEALLLGGVVPVRDGLEIVGYARALELDWIPAGEVLDSERIRRLHAVVLGADPDGESFEPSPWRESRADPEVFDANGRALGKVFPTLPPRLVGERVEDAVSWLEIELRENRHHPITVIGTFVLVLLAANPFDRGNLRVALVLAQRLLYAAGYAYLPYVSFEAVLDEEREAMYAAFDASQTRLWTGEANLAPWLDFFSSALETHAGRVKALRRAERRATELSPLQRAIVEAVREHGTVEAGLLISETGANRNTLKDNLRRLVERGVLERSGQRRGTRYRLAEPSMEPFAGFDH